MNDFAFLWVYPEMTQLTEINFVFLIWEICVQFEQFKVNSMVSVAEFDSDSILDVKNIQILFCCFLKKIAVGLLCHLGYYQGRMT